MSVEKGKINGDLENTTDDFIYSKVEKMITCISSINVFEREEIRNAVMVILSEVKLLESIDFFLNSSLSADITKNIRASLDDNTKGILDLKKILKSYLGNGTKNIEVPLKTLKLGEVVRVIRSSGEIDDGWYVIALSDEGGCIVSKGTLTKVIENFADKGYIFSDPEKSSFVDRAAELKILISKDESDSFGASEYEIELSEIRNTRLVATNYTGYDRPSLSGNTEFLDLEKADLSG